MRKKNRQMAYYYFKTFGGRVFAVLAGNFAEAEEKAANKNKVAEYIGWQPLDEVEL